MGVGQQTPRGNNPGRAVGESGADSLGWGAVAGPLARLVYHDLRHPLTAILAYSEFLVREDLHRSEREDFHQEICLAVSRMNDLICSLLEVSKAQRPRLTEIASTIARGIRLVTVRPEFRCVSVRYEHVGVTEGRFDPGGLQQVITNIVLNACEAVSPVSGRVEVRSSGRQDSLEISVSDNGPGIPKPIRHSLFQRFVSYDKAGGMGLGLAIVQKILRDHGGNIYLDATGEEGTVFRVLLPLGRTEGNSLSPNEDGGTLSLSDGNRQRPKIACVGCADTFRN